MKKYTLLIFGLLMIVGGVLLTYLKIDKQKKCTEETTATVVNVKRRSRKRRGRRKLRYYPVVKFTAGGREVIGTADESSGSSSRYKVGDTLTVKYNPDDPEMFMSDGANYFADMVGGVMAVLLGIFIVVLFVKGQRKTSEENP